MFLDYVWVDLNELSYYVYIISFLRLLINFEGFFIDNSTYDAAFANFRLKKPTFIDRDLVTLQIVSQTSLSSTLVCLSDSILRFVL